MTDEQILALAAEHNIGLFSTDPSDDPTSFFPCFTGDTDIRDNVLAFARAVLLMVASTTPDQRG